MFSGFRSRCTIPLVVSGGQPLGDRRRDLQRGPPRQRAGGRQTPAQRFPFQKLQHREGDAAFPAHVVDGQDVRVRQRGDGASFSFEAGECFGVTGDGLRQDLDGHVAAEPPISAPDRPRPSLPRRSGPGSRRARASSPREASCLLEERRHATSRLSSVAREGVRARRISGLLYRRRMKTLRVLMLMSALAADPGLRGQARDQLRVGQDGELRQPEDLRLVYGSQVPDAPWRIDRGRAVRRRARPGGRRAGSREEGLREGPGGDRRHPRLVRDVRGRRRQPGQIRPLRLVVHDDLRRRQVPEEGLADAGHPRSRTETGLARGEGGDPGNEPRKSGT